MNDVKTTVLNRIKSGEITMRPRWHFILKSILLLLGVIIITLWLIYLVSFIVFTLSSSGIVILPIFGLQGIITFLFALPWLLILIAIVFMIVLELLVKKYSFGYRKPLLYSVLGMLFVTALGTIIVFQTSIHDIAMQRARESRLPIFGNLYQGYGLKPDEHIHIGEVLELNRNGFVINERMNGRLKINIDANTRIPREDIIKVGDHVIVLGKKINDEVYAQGVRHFFGKMFKPIEQIEERIEHGESREK